MKDESNFMGYLVGFLLTIAFVGILSWMAWPDSEDADLAARSAGNAQVQLGGWAYFKCGADDLRGWYFSAVNAQGNQVAGVVCCGALKGCTVRY